MSGIERQKDDSETPTRNHAADQIAGTTGRSRRVNSVPADAAPVTRSVPPYRQGERCPGEYGLLLAQRKELQRQIQKLENVPRRDSQDLRVLKTPCDNLAFVELRLADFDDIWPDPIDVRPIRRGSWPGDSTTRYAETPCPTRVSDYVSLLPTQTSSSPICTVDGYSCQSDVGPSLSRKRAPSSSSVLSSPCAKRQQRSYLSTLPIAEELSV
jgi:hypothetical protein